MTKFRFVRKNGKVLGPLTADRINHFFSEGKLAPDDELSENQEGPWHSVAALQERIERTKKAKQARAEKPSAKPTVDTSAVPPIPDANRAAQNVDPSEAGDPPDAPDPLASTPDFPDPLAAAEPVFNAGPFDNTAYTPPVPTSPINSIQPKTRSSYRSGEELDATDPWRWIFPWKWETDTQPFPMLVVYLKLSQAILILSYLLFMVFGFVCLIYVGIESLRSADDESLAQTLATTFIGIPIVGLGWWAVAQLIFIAGMAGIDLLRCLLAIERNTR